MDPVQAAPAPVPRRRFGDVAGFYLPRRVRRWFVYLPLDALLLLLALALTLSAWACQWRAEPYFEPELPADVRGQFDHLESVLRASARPGGRLDLTTGYSTLCGYSTEWRPIYFVFHAMALGERARAEPASAPACAELLTLCARGVLRVPDEVTGDALPAFLAAREYDSAPVQTGYEGVVLGVRRLVAKDDRFDEGLRRCADALAAWLERCLAGAEPLSFWTSDQAVQVHAIWLCDQALGSDHRDLLARWEAAMRSRFLEPGTGLLCSEVATVPDRVVTPPMGSSVAWTAVFLADALPALAGEQYAAFGAHRERRLLSFGASKEHASSFEFGDTNSGPLILGFSPAATGFALCAHKLHDDPDRFARALRVFEVFGRPRRAPGGRLRYYLGNAMGDAILAYAKVARPRRRR